MLDGMLELTPPQSRESYWKRQLPMNWGAHMSPVWEMDHQLSWEDCWVRLMASSGVYLIDIKRRKKWVRKSELIKLSYVYAWQDCWSTELDQVSFCLCGTVLQLVWNSSKQIHNILTCSPVLDQSGTVLDWSEWSHVKRMPNLLQIFYCNHLEPVPVS